MRKLRTQAIGQVRPRACDPRFFPSGTNAVDAVPGVSWRCATAGGRRGLWSFDRNQPLCFLRFAGVWRKTVFGPDSQQASRSQSAPRQTNPRSSFPSGEEARGVAGLPCRSAQLKTYLALSSLRPLRARDGVTTETGLGSCSGRRSRKAATWLILPVVICLFSNLYFDGK